MDPNQSLILMFVMQKMHQKKLKKRYQESIIQLLAVYFIFLAQFNSESKTSLFTNA